MRINAVNYTASIMIYNAMLCLTLLQLTHHHFLAPFGNGARHESNNTKNVARLWKKGVATSLKYETKETFLS